MLCSVVLGYLLCFDASQCLLLCFSQCLLLFYYTVLFMFQVPGRDKCLISAPICQLCAQSLFKIGHCWSLVAIVTVHIHSENLFWFLARNSSPLNRSLGTVMHCTVFCCAMLCCVVFRCAMLCCVVLCSAVLCCAVLCYGLCELVSAGCLALHNNGLLPS